MAKPPTDTPTPTPYYACHGCERQNNEVNAHRPQDLTWWDGWGWKLAKNGFIKVNTAVTSAGWYCVDCVPDFSYEEPRPEHFGPTLAAHLAISVNKQKDLDDIGA